MNNIEARMDSIVYFALLFHAWVTKFCHRVLVPPPSYIDTPTVLHQEASLQKTCALEKNQAANKPIISPIVSQLRAHY